jgi:hypothetical protein
MITIILLVNFLIAKILAFNASTALSIECLINNLEYSFEYLHTSDDTDQLEKVYHRNIYTFPLEEIDNFDYLRWSLIQIDGLSDTFYITSHLFNNEYLCSSFKFDDVFRTRRMIYRRDLKKQKNNDNCKWKLLKLESYSNNRTFRIKNLKYKEYLYADETHFRRDSFKRNIYLFGKSPSNETNQYDWLVDCSRGTFIIN